MADISVSPVDIQKIKGTVIVFMHNGKQRLAPLSQKFDDAHDNVVTGALKFSRFTGEAGEIFNIPTPGLKHVDTVIAIGMGQQGNDSLDIWRRAGVWAGKALEQRGHTNATAMFEAPKNSEKTADHLAEAFLEGLEMAVYRFDMFRTTLKDHQKATFKTMTVMLDGKPGKDLAARLPLLAAQTEGSNLARDLVNLPPNIANPDYMVREANRLSRHGVKVTVLGEKEMEKLGMNMLLAVGRGAEEESRLIIMKYTGNKSSKKTHAIVGKGVMFDTGGYNLKGGAGMEWMKSDMGGAAAVMGAMRALAKRKSKVNVIGVCGCVVNKVDARAFLPSDVLTAYNGKTVEIGNTDAEGRLVLGDAMAYIIDKEKPSEIIDLATLTGAVMGALGGSYGGLFTQQDDMAEALTTAGQASGEKLWRLPMGETYIVKPKIADLNNNGMPYGGASAAAMFLKNFVGKTPWAHLDIAGVAMLGKVPGEYDLEGASGFGVRLLVNYLENQ